jgi:hypothetical protein
MNKDSDCDGNGDCDGDDHNEGNNNSNQLVRGMKEESSDIVDVKPPSILDISKSPYSQSWGPSPSPVPPHRARYSHDFNGSQNKSEDDIVQMNTSREPSPNENIPSVKASSTGKLSPNTPSDRDVKIEKTSILKRSKCEAFDGDSDSDLLVPPLPKPTAALRPLSRPPQKPLQSQQQQQPSNIGRQNHLSCSSSSSSSYCTLSPLSGGSLLSWGLLSQMRTLGNDLLMLLHLVEVELLLTETVIETEI